MAAQSIPSTGTQDRTDGTGNGTAPATASPLDAHRSPTASSSTRSGKATTAMVLGILGVLAGLLIPIAGIVLGIVAIVMGSNARSDIKRTGCQGAGQAKAGLILGIVALVVSVLAWVAAVAIMAS